VEVAKIRNIGHSTIEGKIKTERKKSLGEWTRIGTFRSKRG
jgi:hypothetical protein